MPAHRHVHHGPPQPSADALAEARWEDDGGPVTPESPDAEALRAEWLRVSAELTARFPDLSRRDDVIVTCEPRTVSGAKAAFFPELALTEIDQAVFAPFGPEKICPAEDGDEDRYPAAWGALVHEAGHATHSAWMPPPEAVGTAANSAAEILEESRTERAHLRYRPEDRTYLRACVTSLVTDDLSGSDIDGTWAAAHAAGLILARRDVGILLDEEVEPLEAKVTEILGYEVLGELASIWNAAFGCADDDGETMLALGKAWCEALGQDPDQPEPSKDEQRSAEPNATTGKIWAAIAEVGELIAATEARQEVEHAAADRRDRRKAKAAADRAAAELAKKVFAPEAAAIVPEGFFQDLAENPITGSREPKRSERKEAGKLARALRQAAYRERASIPTTSAAPPGRLIMRQALARDAQKAAGAVPTAEPWRHTRRLTTPTPPLRVGIAVDVSGSMKPAVGPIASATWILARAAAATDPDSRTATVAYDSGLTAINRPGRTPRQVVNFAAEGGQQALAEAIDVLNVGLELTRPGAGRVLVAATDGVYSTPELETAAERIAYLISTGCAVLQLHVGESETYVRLPGAQFLRVTRGALIDEIGKAVVAAVAATY
ncbi:hypothetical protein ABH935_007042 [Catenulispora sp. GAS73]|uniref:hypothetical protein n=1 Tax=Catenulispora sp. GAS73 TaxID=3156269 RepID=UPI003516051B